MHRRICPTDYRAIAGYKLKNSEGLYFNNGYFQRRGKIWKKLADMKNFFSRHQHHFGREHLLDGLRERYKDCTVVVCYESEEIPFDAFLRENYWGPVK